ncbi:MAG: hypothetical protein RL367_2812, partial [Pseudomonadota bacterium]
RQAGWCTTLGSPITGDVLTVLADTLDSTTETGRRTLAWADDPDFDALPIRIAGGLHALAKRGADLALSALYRSENHDALTIIPRIIAEHDGWLQQWLDRPPQTNEVARSAMLWPGLMAIARRFGPDMALFELGSSAGLNLNLDRFGYDLGGVLAGDQASLVQLKPDWHGPKLEPVPVTIVTRAGVDRDPVDLTDAKEVERLLSFVWVGQDERRRRLEGAIAIAARHPPPVAKGDLVDWLEKRLQEPATPGVTRVVFNSIVLQYVSKAARQNVAALLAEAGAKACMETPLAWLQMEMIEMGKPSELTLQCWPGGDSRLLARVHPHGARIGWLGENGV